MVCAIRMAIWSDGPAGETGPPRPGPRALPPPCASWALPNANTVAPLAARAVRRPVERAQAQRGRGDRRNGYDAVYTTEKNLFIIL